jgi:riboflavin kinase/FMN adenylyltransferase
MVLLSESAPASVVTPGNYDGVHLGHRALLTAARTVSSTAGGALRVVAMTFDPHPTHFVAPERAPELLTTPQRRVELLRGLGADEVVVRRFDAVFAALSPEQFAEQVLGVELGARAVVVGEDFRFGLARAGDVKMLYRLGERFGFEVVEVPKVLVDAAPVSSSRVRASLAQGDVELAARMLGRVHDTSRGVVRGDQRGRTIGVPTANLELTGTLAPAPGVYAVVARVLGEDPADPGVYLGVANLGTRPTVAAGRSFEVHLLDFDRDIYDRQLRVGFVRRLRDERKFPDLAALKAQIARDIAAARRAVESCEPELLTWI